MNVAVRNAEKTDLETILTLQKLCYREIGERYNDFSLPPLVETMPELETVFPSHTILKAEIEGKVVGSIRGHVESDPCHIGRLIVHPKYRNRGIGRKLIRELENRFPDAARFELFTGHLEEKSIYLYTSEGYTPFKEERESEAVRLVFLEKRTRDLPGG